MNGSIGQQLSCGAFTLKVTEVFVGDSYAKRFSDGQFDAYPDGNKVELWEPRLCDEKYKGG